MTRLNRWVAFLGLFLVLGWSVPTEAATTLKMASLAPKKSTWTKIFKRLAKELNAQTDGEVTVDLYVSGVQGDEKEVVEKMRTGQIQMAAITAVGLGKIVPDALIFQLPGLFDTPKELDRARKAVAGKIEAKMEAEGFILLGWGDVGPYYFFTNTPVVTPSDLANVKLWVWTDDPIAQAVARHAGANGVPMGVPSVTAALANGKVDGYFSSPLVAASLRWYNRVTHVSPTPIAMGIGAMVISKKAFEALSKSQQSVLRELASKAAGMLTKKVRKDNRKTLKLMAAGAYEDAAVNAAGRLTVGAPKEGATKPVVSSFDDAAWQAVFRKVQDDLAGKVYPKALLDEVRGLVK